MGEMADYLLEHADADVNGVLEAPRKTDRRNAVNKSIICHKCGQSTSIKYFFCPWCGVSLTIAERRKTVRRGRPHNTGSPKLPPCKHCSDVVTLERMGGWLDRGYKLCPYCGRQLRAGA